MKSLAWTAAVLAMLAWQVSAVRDLLEASTRRLHAGMGLVGNAGGHLGRNPRRLGGIRRRGQRGFEVPGPAAHADVARRA